MYLVIAYDRHNGAMQNVRPADCFDDGVAELHRQLGRSPLYRVCMTREAPMVLKVRLGDVIVGEVVDSRVVEGATRELIDACNSLEEGDRAPLHALFCGASLPEGILHGSVGDR